MLRDLQTLRSVVIPVNEIYASIQGEAKWTGTPTWFIRTQGCPVGCPWCDTKYTWEADPEKQKPILQVLTKKASDATWNVINADAILGVLATKPDVRHVVITGGEPCLHEYLGPLTRILVEAKYTVQIETSGTFPIDVDPATWVTCSPKIGMPGGRTIIAESIARANEVKYPVGRERDIKRLLQEVLPLVNPDALVWLQPISQNKKATALCVEAAMKHGFRVSAQVHKFLDLP